VGGAVVIEGAETVRFVSRNPDGFRELLSDRARSELAPVPLTGFLRLPEHVAGPVSLVITSIGSGGFASGREALYADAFAAAGIAMLAVDSFASRGFSETRSDQGRISMATSCADAVYALDYVSKDPRIDSGRIALFGYSRGGGAVLMTDHERLQGAILGSAQRFAAYIAMYPSVWLRWAQPLPTSGPILAVFPEDDDMAPLARQRERVDVLAKAGADIETVVIPAVGHSFDAVYAAAHRDESNRRDWDIAVDADGSMLETTSGIRQTSDWASFLRDVGAVRITRGGTTGHSAVPRTVAVPSLINFLQHTLLAVP
jgi:dienelactone hydrolase